MGVKVDKMPGERKGRHDLTRIELLCGPRRAPMSCGYSEDTASVQHKRMQVSASQMRVQATRGFVRSRRATRAVRRERHRSRD